MAVRVDAAGVLGGACRWANEAWEAAHIPADGPGRPEEARREDGQVAQRVAVEVAGLRGTPPGRG